MFEEIKKIINKNSEIIRYVIVGGLTTLVSLLSYYICIWLFLNPDNGYNYKSLILFPGYYLLHLHILLIENMYLSQTEK